MIGWKDPLVAQLLKAFGAPKRVKTFELRIAVGEPVTARATWLVEPLRVEAGKVVEEFGVFKLVRDPVNTVIERRAKEALAEIKAMVDNARRDLGIPLH